MSIADNLQDIEPSFKVLVDSYDYEKADACLNADIDLNIAADAKDDRAIILTIRLRLLDQADKETVFASFAIAATVEFKTTWDRRSKLFAEVLLYTAKLVLFDIEQLFGAHTHPDQYIAGVLENSRLSTGTLYKHLYNGMPYIYPLQFDNSGRIIEDYER